MRAVVALVGAMLVSSAGVAYACDLTKDPRPTWEEMINEADVVFVGTAVEIQPTASLDRGDRVVFEVELPVKGAVGSRFEHMQGASTCDHTFELGAHVIFAGRALSIEDGEMHIFVEDTGWDPTVTLADPPTAAQVAQLQYLKQIAVDQ